MKDLQILLVEDNDGDIFLTTEFLETECKAGSINVLRDGEEAISFLEEIENNPAGKKPDLVILDINLPRKNGHEVLQFIRSHEQLKDLEVIMLTTSASPRDISLAKNFSANGFITKPLDTHNCSVLISTLKTLQGK